MSVVYDFVYDLEQAAYIHKNPCFYVELQRLFFGNPLEAVEH
jgi:hypothetical protein